MFLGAVLVAVLLAVGGLWQVVHSIRDCTDPEGRCYREAQKRTGDAVGNLVLSDVRVSECVVVSAGDVTAFRRCVRARGLPMK